MKLLGQGDKDFFPNLMKKKIPMQAKLVFCAYALLIVSSTFLGEGPAQTRLVGAAVMFCGALFATYQVYCYIQGDCKLIANLHAAAAALVIGLVAVSLLAALGSAVTKEGFKDGECKCGAEDGEECTCGDKGDETFEDEEEKFEGHEDDEGHRDDEEFVDGAECPDKNKVCPADEDGTVPEECDDKVCPEDDDAPEEGAEEVDTVKGEEEPEEPEGAEEVEGFANYPF